MSGKPFYITTAIAYPNGPPHIGHAYEAIATDAIARFARLDGRDVFFLTGTDEHGIKMLQTAAKEKLTPRELVERNVPRFQAMVRKFNCSNDDFIRTTEPRHYRSSEAIWQRMEAAGDIYLDKYSGWYSVRDEAYYDESETRLDDKGQRVGPQGTPVEWVEEESYFFKLSAFADRLLDLYKRNPEFVLPKERMNEVASFVRGGLNDLSLSRTTFDWGIKVPGNPKHIMYVWVDALTNYITAVGYPDTDSEKFKKYWPADLHVIGKDIVRFHAVYWPAFLISAGIEVPRRVFSHGFLFNRGEKMSKSVGNVIDPFALADAYGVDQLRYFLLREVPFGQDGNYSHEAIVNRINADLANDLGNLAQRSLTMVARAFGGVLPKPGPFSAADQAILAAVDAMIGKARDAMATQQLHQVLNLVWAVVADANRYFAGEAPWALAKTDPARQGTVLYATAEVLRQIAILALPFMPDAAGKLLDLLAVPAGERVFALLGGHHRIAAGNQLPASTPVLPRYVENPDSAPPPGPKQAVFPVEKLDLELAFKRVKADLQLERYFVHSPLEIELVEVALNDWLNQLSKKIAEGYHPHPAFITDVPKGNGAVRPGALLTLEDRVVYAAAVGAILPSINAGLRWSQGKVDFAYRLSERPRRVEWFTNQFNSWSAFRKASIERIDKGATYVVLTDITGFYENIDLPTLFSELRSLNADADVIRLLEVCLNRWCAIPNRGIPQGSSPSDVLAKVYLNTVDRAFADIEIDYIRYVDDIRIFCREIPASKKALMSLTQAMRRRGLSLQSAKTEIAAADDARRTIEGIVPIINDLVRQYREFVEEMGSANPYSPISQIEENVKPDDAPVELVQEAFRLNFVAEAKTFDKTLFHFLINRLGAQRDGYALGYCLDQLTANPQETRTVLQYVERVGDFERAFGAMEIFLNSPDCIYDYQTYQIFRWLNLVPVPPSPGLIAIARRIAFDNARPPFLRAVCRIVLQRHGTMADLDRFEASYGTIHEELERAQVLVNLRGLELERRNAFYRRAAGDGELCRRAIKLVQKQPRKAR